VTKVNAAGSALTYFICLGGNGEDKGNEIAVDSADSVYLTGITRSTAFPTARPLQPAFGRISDAFVANIPSPSVRVSGVKRNFPVQCLALPARRKRRP
jgi:hypothetical protein